MKEIYIFMCTLRLFVWGGGVLLKKVFLEIFIAIYTKKSKREMFI